MTFSDLERQQHFQRHGVSRDDTVVSRGLSATAELHVELCVRRVCMSGRSADVPSVGRRASADGFCDRSHSRRESLVPRVDHQRGHVRRRRLRRRVPRADDCWRQQKTRQRRELDGWLERGRLHPCIPAVNAWRSRQAAAGIARKPVARHRPALQVRF